ERHGREAGARGAGQHATSPTRDPGVEPKAGRRSRTPRRG
ncbi:MAG: hypothetical protein AVDCRST_MAG64-3053, partial [uncultured Phycisphaerae bacterium]